MESNLRDPEAFADWAVLDVVTCRRLAQKEPQKRDQRGFCRRFGRFGGFSFIWNLTGGGFGLRHQHILAP